MFRGELPSLQSCTDPGSAFFRRKFHFFRGHSSSKFLPSSTHAESTHDSQVAAAVLSDVTVIDRNKPMNTADLVSDAPILDHVFANFLSYPFDDFRRALLADLHEAHFLPGLCRVLLPCVACPYFVSHIGWQRPAFLAFESSRHSGFDFRPGMNFFRDSGKFFLHSRSSKHLFRQTHSFDSRLRSVK